MTLTNTEIARYIDKTADEIERRGLAAGALIFFEAHKPDTECKVCVLGALGIARGAAPGVGYVDDFTYGSQERAEYGQIVQAVAKRLDAREYEFVKSDPEGAEDSAYDPILFQWSDALAIANRPDLAVSRLREIAADVRNEADETA